MDGWIKYFEDGTYESGSDKDVFEGTASWTKGQLHDIQSVAAHHGNRHICITGSGQFWQSNDYEIEVFGKSPKVITRRIQRKLTAGDFAIAFYRTEHSLMLRVVDVNDSNSLVYADSNIGVRAGEIGSWLTLEYHAETGTTGFYISEEKI